MAVGDLVEDRPLLDRDPPPATIEKRLDVSSLERSRRNGFQGRLCVHPDQIAPVNAAYLPSAAELARAERIVAAFKQAEAAGQAAIQVDGEMVDYPVAYRAQTMIDAVRAARKN